MLLHRVVILDLTLPSSSRAWNHDLLPNQGPVPIEFLLDQRRIEVLQYTKHAVDILAHLLPDAIINSLLDIPSLPIDVDEIQRFSQLEVAMLVERFRDVDFWLATGVPAEGESEYESLYANLISDINAFLGFLRIPRPSGSTSTFNPYHVKLDLPSSALDQLHVNLARRAESGRAYKRLKTNTSAAT